jgi:hypothetical protein
MLSIFASGVEVSFTMLDGTSLFLGQIGVVQSDLHGR